jgi:predicted permease
MTVLAVAGTGTIFALLQAALLRPFSTPESGALVSLRAVNNSNQRYVTPLSPPDLADLVHRNRSLEEVAAWREQTLVLTSVDARTPVAVAIGTPNIFRVLRTGSALGSGFVPAAADAPPSATMMVSDAFWRSHLSARPDLNGTTVVLNNVSYEVVGVLHRDFQIPGSQVDVWIPYPVISLAGSRAARAYHSAIARLLPESTLESVREDLNAIARQLEAEHPATNNGWRVDVQLFGEYLLGAPRQTIVALFWLSVLVLVLATVSLSAILLAQTFDRSPDIAIRSVLGATPRTVAARAVLTPITIAGFVIAAAVPSAALVTRMLSSSVSRGSVFFLAEPSIAVVAAIFGGLVVPIAPVIAVALIVMRVASQPIMGGRVTDRLAGLRWSATRVLVAVQISIAFVLLYAAIIGSTSYISLRDRRLGFDPENLVTARVNTAQSTAAGVSRLSLFERFLEASRSVEGVTGAALASVVPLAGTLHEMSLDFTPPSASSETRYNAAYRVVSPGYFSVIGSRVVAGRGFVDRDDATGEAVIVVNEAFAAQLAEGDSLPGQMVTMHYVTPERRRVVGVVENVSADSGPDPVPTAYVPIGQAAHLFSEMTLVVRTEPHLFNISDLRASINQLTPDFPMYGIRSMAWLRRDALTREVVLMYVALSLAAIALLVAVFGVTGMLKMSYAAQAHDLAMRAALGATTWHLVSRAFVRLLLLASAGIAFGIGLVFAFRSLIFLPAALDTVEQAQLVIAATGGILAAIILGFLIPIRQLTGLDIMNLIRTR